jgi:hypothetical protein
MDMDIMAVSLTSLLGSLKLYIDVDVVLSLGFHARSELL